MSPSSSEASPKSQKHQKVTDVASPVGETAWLDAEPEAIVFWFSKPIVLNSLSQHPRGCSCVCVSAARLAVSTKNKATFLPPQDTLAPFPLLQAPLYLAPFPIHIPAPQHPIWPPYTCFLPFEAQLASRTYLAGALGRSSSSGMGFHSPPSLARRRGWREGSGVDGGGMRGARDRSKC